MTHPFFTYFLLVSFALQPFAAYAKDADVCTSLFQGSIDNVVAHPNKELAEITDLAQLTPKQARIVADSKISLSSAEAAETRVRQSSVTTSKKRIPTQSERKKRSFPSSPTRPSKKFRKMFRSCSSRFAPQSNMRPTRSGAKADKKFLDGFRDYLESKSPAWFRKSLSGKLDSMTSAEKLTLMDYLETLGREYAREEAACPMKPRTFKERLVDTKNRIMPTLRNVGGFVLDRALKVSQTDSWFPYFGASGLTVKKLKQTEIWRSVMLKRKNSPA